MTLSELIAEERGKKDREDAKAQSVREFLVEGGAIIFGPTPWDFYFPFDNTSRHVRLVRVGEVIHFYSDEGHFTSFEDWAKALAKSVVYEPL